MQTPFPMPPVIIEQATRYQIGNFHTTYMPKISNALIIIAIALAIIVADAILFMIILAIGYILYILVLIPIFAIIYAIRAIPACSIRIYEFSNGIIKAHGNKIEVIRWEQIESVWQEQNNNSDALRAGLIGGLLGALIHRNTSSSTNYKIHTHQNTWITLNTVGNIEQLGTNIQLAVAKVYLPLAIAAFEAGQPVTFGLFSLNHQGIADAGSHLLPWEHVRGTQVNPTSVTVLQNGNMQQLLSAPIAKIPNLTVFTSLVDHILYMRNRQAQKM